MKKQKNESSNGSVRNLVLRLKGEVKSISKGYLSFSLGKTTDCSAKGKGPPNLDVCVSDVGILS